MSSKPVIQHPPASLKTIAVVSGLGAAAILCSTIAGFVLWSVLTWLDRIVF